MNLHVAYSEKDIAINISYTFEKGHSYKYNIITRIAVVTTNGSYLLKVNCAGYCSMCLNILIQLIL